MDEDRDSLQQPSTPVRFAPARGMIAALLGCLLGCTACQVPPRSLADVESEVLRELRDGKLITAAEAYLQELERGVAPDQLPEATRALTAALPSGIASAVIRSHAEFISTVAPVAYTHVWAAVTSSADAGKARQRLGEALKYLDEIAASYSVLANEWLRDRARMELEWR